MKTNRAALITLLAVASLAVSTASEAKTIFERLAPPLLPIPVPVLVSVSSGPVWRDEDRRYEERREWRRYDRYDRHERREWRRHERHDDWHHDHDHYERGGYRR